MTTDSNNLYIEAARKGLGLLVFCLLSGAIIALGITATAFFLVGLLWNGQ